MPQKMYAEVAQGQEIDENSKHMNKPTNLKCADKILIFLTLVSIFTASILSFETIHNSQTEINRRKRKNFKALANTAFILNRYRINMPAISKNRMLSSQKISVNHLNQIDHQIDKIGLFQETKPHNKLHNYHTGNFDKLWAYEKGQNKLIENLKERQPLMKQDQVIIANPQVTVRKGKDTRSIQFAKKHKSIRVQSLAKKREFLGQEYKYFEKTHSISKYDELPLCIIIPTLNRRQKSRFEKNFDSILHQSYKNYHIVVISDKSDDHTGELIHSYIKNLHKNNPLRKFNIQVHHNHQKQNSLANIHKAAHYYCEREQILIIIAKGKELLSHQVFKIFNSVFQKDKSWMISSNLISFVDTAGSPQSKAQEIKEEGFKGQKKQLFNKVKDAARFESILEMIEEGITSIPELTYLENPEFGQNSGIYRHEQASNDIQSDNKQLGRRIEEGFFGSTPNF